MLTLPRLGVGTQQPEATLTWAGCCQHWGRQDHSYFPSHSVSPLFSTLPCGSETTPRNRERAPQLDNAGRDKGLGMTVEETFLGFQLPIAQKYKKIWVVSFFLF